MLRSFFAHEEGQGLVEYALILVLISVAVMGIMVLLGTEVGEVFERIRAQLETGNNATP